MSEQQDLKLELEESPTLGAFAGALAKAQGAMHHASKDKTNPHFKSRYADLASMLDACREALAANGLAVIQKPGNADGGVVLTTMVVHASGEWVRARLWMPVAQQSAQAYGSALTYARRYSLASIVGIAADEDDDGNAASTSAPSAPRATSGTPVPASGKRVAEVKAAASARRLVIQEESSDKPNLKRLEAMAAKYGWEMKGLGVLAKNTTGKASPKELTPEDFAKLEAACIALAGDKAVAP